MKTCAFENRGKWLADLVALFAAFFALYMGLSFMRPLASPDEGRYSEIPLEMVRSGDCVSPTLNDMAYFYKPPLCYWLGAASIKVFGANKFAFRLPNSLMGVLGVLLSYCAARALYGRRAGLFAAAFLGTCILYCALANIITLDMTVSVLIAGAMFSFIVGIGAEGRKRTWLVLAFFAFCALVVMAKGLIGILIPFASIFIYALLFGVRAFFGKFSKADLVRAAAGCVLFLAIAAPWHVLASIANPPYDCAEGVFSKNWEGQGFFWYYIIHEHILRFVDPSTSMREQPWWFFLVLAPVGFLPFVLLMPYSVRDWLRGGLKSLRSGNGEILFFFSWTLFTVLFFSVSSSKLPAYILPIYPALAVALGGWFAGVWEGGNLGGLRLMRNILAGLGFVAAIALIVLYFVLEHKGKLMEKAPDMLAVSIAASATISLLTCVAIFFARKGREKAFWLCAFATVFAIGIFFNPVAAFVQRASAEPLVEKIAAERTGGDVYAIAFDYNIFQDFPVWLGQTVYTLGYVPEEQKFGFMRARKENAPRFIETPEAFAALVKSAKGNVYVAVKDAERDAFARHYRAKFEVVARERNLELLKIAK
ncbi:MAG: glycosyltransferase family 39 protein [Opitutales bacterium]|nr:glycosyltransferase family 39 protein [Opitutales bacterium]